MKSFTSTTLSRRADLERELAHSRLQGFTVDLAEGIEGIHCVAAPILDEYGAPLAAVTTMAPLARLPRENFEKVGARVMEAARQIQQRLRL